MTARLSNYDFLSIYESSQSDLVVDFYIPAMMRAIRYDRAVGYFRSSILHLVSIAVSDFVLRGGKMRLICSPSLDEMDEQIIRESGVSSSQIDRAITADIRATLRDPTVMPVTELLATMLEMGSLEVRVAYKADARGIFHTKVGIFCDEFDDAISFDGSANETYIAWSHNEERFKTFSTWMPGGSVQVQADQEYFDQLWAGRRPSLIVQPLPDVAREELRHHASPDPQAAIEKVRELARSRPRTRHAPKQLQDHQLAVLSAWRSSKSGLIDHVTGGGKTITALACVREWFALNHRASVLIVVPSDLLTLQWRDEIDRELENLGATVLHAGGARSGNWRDHLSDLLRKADSKTPRIVIATMDTAASSDFMSRASVVGDATFMIIDEVHKIGSPTRRRVLELQPGARLGLSATPQRYGDPEGTNVILDFFGNVLEPHFTIADAQNSRPPRLVQYTYHLNVVALTSQETSQYRSYTKSIASLIAQAKSGMDPSAAERLRLIALQRARILKSAHHKVQHAVSLLQEEYRRGDRWLVYCDNTVQLDHLAYALHSVDIPTTRYLAVMESSKPETLDRFARLGGILLSIRCLDEGIDIPTISHALILASSLNPREHLQRRGRVLRTAPGKLSARIFDTLVGIVDQGEDIRVLHHELERARAFAADARNARQAHWAIQRLRAEHDDSFHDIEPD